jgi:hypothetical protein
MRLPYQGLGAAVRAMAVLALCGSAQAGMQLESVAVEPESETAPVHAAAAPAPTLAAPRPRLTASPVPAPAQRRDEKAAWTPCIRLINAAAMGAVIDADRHQALLEHCAP